MKAEIAVAGLERKHKLEAMAEAQAGEFKDADYMGGRHWAWRLLKAEVPLALAVEETLEAGSAAQRVG